MGSTEWFVPNTIPVSVSQSRHGLGSERVGGNGSGKLGVGGRWRKEEGTSSSAPAGQEEDSLLASTRQQMRTRDEEDSLGVEEVIGTPQQTP
jgi:hypothetical protein